MIYPPDDLLADLQSTIPEPPPSSRSSKYDTIPDLPGADREVFEVPPGYDPPALSPTGSDQFDDDAYSTVSHKPRYVPKPRESPPPPAKPRRTDRPDYDTTANFRKPPPPAESDGGVQELDALLDMLSGGGLTDPDEDVSSSRPAVAKDIMNELNELNEVEQKVSQTSTKSAPPPASSATQELDSLMDSLFMNDQPPPPKEQTYAKPHRDKPKSQAANDLDSMLGSIQTSMNERGIDTSSKGICAACDKPIFTKIIKAMNKVWHPEHFTCTVCELELATVVFYEHMGKPYCEKDYHELFAPRCAYCNGPILDKCMKALNKTWHPEHFFCALCGKHFGAEGFHEKDGKAFCRECYYEKFAPRCKRCDTAIFEGFISAFGSQWHSECFTCKVCGKEFPRGDYYDYEGEPHCEIHYHAQRGTLCAQCQKPITGQCVSAMGKKFHPDHFTCSFCLKLLNKGTFKEHRSNAYCQPCYIKLFG